MDDDDANGEEKQFSLEGVDVRSSLLLMAHQDGSSYTSQGKNQQGHTSEVLDGVVATGVQLDASSVDITASSANDGRVGGRI